jgi:hypothetical protein
MASAGNSGDLTLSNEEQERDNSGLKYALLDLNWPSGEQFCSHLLNTGDFPSATLRSIYKSSANKEALASRLAALIVNDDSLADSLIRAFCQQSRQWLALAKRIPISPRVPQRKHSAREMLTGLPSPRKDTWYGPWQDTLEPSVTWLVRSIRARHFVQIDGTNQLYRQAVQGHLVAEVGPSYIAIHWNGFSHKDTDNEGGARNHQFYYWKHIPKLLEELADMFGCQIEYPVLSDLVLGQIMSSYDERKDFNWQHIRIRSMRAGVALNARGTAAPRPKGSRQDFDMSGLKALSMELAKSALRSVSNRIAAEDLKKAEVAVLLTLIKEWGTRSYEFSLDKTDPTLSGQDKKMIRAHCYFGTGGPTGWNEDEAAEGSGDNDFGPGPDSFPHLFCYKPYGGSRRALKFVLAELRWAP